MGNVRTVMTRPEPTATIDGLWRFEAPHPEWTEEDGGEDGWEQIVSWWAVASPGGLVLIDPLVEDWDALDRLLERAGGCAGIIRTLHWHQRSIAEAAARYSASVWAKPGEVAKPFDHPITDGDELFGVARALDMERFDEVALWLVAQRTLVFGDAMLRSSAGALRICPESWTQPEGGAARLRALLGALNDLPVEHVLVSHGPLVLGGGRDALRAATA